MSITSIIKNILGRLGAAPVQTPANAGEMEIAMSDTTTAPPAANGGLTKADLEALLKPLADTVTGLASGFKTLSEGHKALSDSVSKAGSGLKAEDVASLVTKQLADAQKAQTEASAASQAKSTVRAKVLAAKLPGVHESLLASLPDTADEAALTTAADALRKTLDGMGVKLADVGGVTKDGGTTPAAAAAGGVTAGKYTPENSGLSAAGAAYANALVLPK